MKAIVTRWLPDTGSLPTRVAAFDIDGNRVEVPVAGCPDNDTPYNLAALRLCRAMGWTGRLVSGQIPGGDIVFIWDEPICRLDVPPKGSVA